GNLIIVSGPSGSGKDTILQEVFKLHGDIEFSISNVTRERREGDGDKYHFISKEEFLKLLENDMMLEYNEYVGNYYGTPRLPVEKAISEGRDVVVEIDVNGAANIKKKMPQAISIFILPPSMEILEKRLTRRGTESEEQIKNRLKQAENEIARISEYDYVVFNDALEDAVRNVEMIILSNRMKYNNQKEIIERKF
ncbi:MAG: guanylate kinase, partial [Oscillospiraceae bacterium]|nr:guanylate kinase [Candidatus Equicaccousia limihippi]